jgi:ATPase subunit of ABC transporter with duplicated ATPase domains
MLLPNGPSAGSHFLSERLDLLDPERTVADNLAAFAPAMPQEQRMNLLARFLFRSARAHLPAGVLSGGELLRAALTCVLLAEGRLLEAGPPGGDQA